MKAMKADSTNTRLRKPYKAHAKDTAALSVKPVASRRRRPAPSVVDDTFAALSIRKHAKIELLIDQMKYAD